MLGKVRGISGPIRRQGTSTTKENHVQKITLCLWFDNQGEVAVNFYASTFKNSKILNIARYGEAGAKASGRPT
jgi:hypothetical protein